MEATQQTQPYVLQIELSVLDHLGINLYSNVPAVMTELVANAWDADAKSVEIRVDLDEGRIEIIDDGHGMTRKDINAKFLTVGYRRRDHDLPGAVTKQGRPVMGRKGVGKLAPFSIAETVEVYTTKDGDRCGLRMTMNGMKEAGRNSPAVYTPEALDQSDLIPAKGTKIILSGLKRERVRRANLRERLARRFSVVGTPDFKVSIDGDEVTSKHRGDLSSSQYIWTIGGWTAPDWYEPVRAGHLRDRETGWDSSWRVRGWIGTSKKPKDLEHVAGNLNGIVVVARGRLFQENILGEINDGRHFTKYLTGQIEADFLDSDDIDIATSDRQRVIEDDPRYIALVSYLKSILNSLEAEWSQWRTEDDPKEVIDQYPQVKEWIASLDAEHRKDAEKMVGTIERMSVSKEQKEEVLRHAIFGFERLKLRGMAKELTTALGSDPAKVIRLLSDHDAMEAVLYRDIVKGRLDTIKILRDAVDRDDQEKILQSILFEKLWLLDPSWERATGTEEIEKQFKSIFPTLKDGANDEASKGRFDIAYQTVAGKHVIVELKRAGRKVSLLELQEQGQKYKDELERLLRLHGRLKAGFSADIEVVFVIGHTLPEQASKPERYKASMDAISPGSRVCTYEQLIGQALAAYSDYLRSTESLDRLNRMIEGIGEP